MAGRVLRVLAVIDLWRAVEPNTGVPANGSADFDLALVLESEREAEVRLTCSGAAAGRQVGGSLPLTLHCHVKK